jgi:hypothetical protein
VRELIGQIEGTDVRLRSSERRPGDTVTFTFAGTLSGNSMSGTVYMGEYLNAKSRGGGTRTRTRVRRSESHPARRSQRREPGSREK